MELYKNNTYHYKQKSLGSTLLNEGRWSIHKGELILTDLLENNNLPIELKYVSKTVSSNKMGIQVLRNLKGELLTDGFVHINEDSIQCLPLTGTCLGKYDKIDSIKVAFENGYKSKWIKVQLRANEDILLTLQSDLVMTSYTSLSHKKYRIYKSYIVPKQK